MDSNKKGRVMQLIARVLVASVLGGFVGAGIGLVLFGKLDGYGFPCFILGCIGSLAGAIAGAAREIAVAMRDK